MYCIKCGKKNEEGSTFCMYCGEPMEVPEQAVPEAELAPEPPAPMVEEVDKEKAEVVVEAVEEVVPETPQPVEPAGQREDPAPFQPPPPRTPFPEKPSSPSFFQKNSRRLIAGGCGLVLIVAVIIAAVFILPGIGGSKGVLYSVAEDYSQYGIQDIWTIDRKGENPTELTSERSGIYIFSSSPFGSPFSPDGNFLLYHTGDDELYLLDIKKETADFIGDTSYPYASFSDKDFFGYLEAGDTFENPELFFVDTKGNELHRESDHILFGYLPGTDSAIVGEYDDRDNVIINVGLIDVSAGKFEELTDIDGNDLRNWPVASPDGKYIFYSENEDLIRIEVRNGKTSYVHEFESNDYSNRIIMFEKNNMGLIYDAATIYLYDIKDDSMEEIDQDVSLGLVLVSPDEKYIAYSVGDGSDMELKVYELASGSSTRIDKGGNYRFEFSPNSKYIVYTESNDLYVSSVDGGDKTRLDRDVYSFLTAQDSKYVYYSVVDDRSGSPESDLYVIKINGDQKEKILNAVDGVVALIKKN